MVQIHPALKTSFIEILRGYLSFHQQQQVYCYEAQQASSSLSYVHRHTRQFS